MTQGHTTLKCKFYELRKLAFPRSRRYSKVLIFHRFNIAKGIRSQIIIDPELMASFLFFFCSDPFERSAYKLKK